jgi:hypothetical protein
MVSQATRVHEILTRSISVILRCRMFGITRRFARRYFTVQFLKTTWLALVISFGVNDGSNAKVSLMLGVGSLISAHAALYPAGIATDETTKLMGSINDLRHRLDDDGNIVVASDTVITQAECLSTYIRETHGGSGMGLYLPGFGKISTQRVFQGMLSDSRCAPASYY